MTLDGNLITDPGVFNGATSGASNLPLNSPSRAVENSRVIKTGRGILYGITVTNTKASAQFVQVFDASAVPADGAVPLFSKSVPAGDAVGIQWLPGRIFLVGLVVCNSSTSATKTLASADCLFDVQFI
jgi:hypothetical protein